MRKRLNTTRIGRVKAKNLCNWNDNYYTTDISKCPDSVRLSVKEKHPNKVMVWVAISNIKPIISSIECRGSRFGHLYKRMFWETVASFFLEHHPDSNYIFWPDLAGGCHYSKQSEAWIDENVKSVLKEFNPPKHVRLRIFGNVWHKYFTREAKRLIRRSCWFVAFNSVKKPESLFLFSFFWYLILTFVLNLCNTSYSPKKMLFKYLV